jgi:hypothetical protein
MFCSLVRMLKNSFFSFVLLWNLYFCTDSGLIVNIIWTVQQLVSPCSHLLGPESRKFRSFNVPSEMFVLG